MANSVGSVSDSGQQFDSIFRTVKYNATHQDKKILEIDSDQYHRTHVIYRMQSQLDKLFCFLNEPQFCSLSERIEAFDIQDSIVIFSSNQYSEVSGPNHFAGYHVNRETSEAEMAEKYFSKLEGQKGLKIYIFGAFNGENFDQDLLPRIKALVDQLGNDLVRDELIIPSKGYRYRAVIGGSTKIEYSKY